MLDAALLLLFLALASALVATSGGSGTAAVVALPLAIVFGLLALGAFSARRRVAR